MGDDVRDDPPVTTGTSTPAWRAHPKGGGRLEAGPPARAWALCIDLALCLMVGFAAACVALLASTVFKQSRELGHGVRFSMDGWTTTPDVPTWVTAAIVLGILAMILGLSGAFSRPGRRRSLGLAMAELRLVRWPIPARSAASRSEPAALEPSRWRVAARWLVPVVVLVLLAQVLPVWGAGLVTVAAWLPALVGRRRSVYDVLSGTAVVDGERLAASVTPEPGQEAVPA